MDRNALIEEAAHKIDVLAGHYGPDEDVRASPEGDLARTLSKEIAEFDSYPDLLEITSDDFAASGQQVPPAFLRRTEEHAFYWMRLPIALRTKLNWAFSRLEVGTEFSPDETDPLLRPTAYGILPNRQFQDLLQTKAQLRVGFDANFELTAGIPAVDLTAVGVPASAQAEASARMGAGLGVATNYQWRIQKAKIEHTQTGLTRVFWRIDGPEFFAQELPELIVVLQVPRAAREVKVSAAMQAYRHLSLLNANLQQRILGLPRRLKDYFTGGSPMRDEAFWDITPVVSSSDA